MRRIGRMCVSSYLFLVQQFTEEINSLLRKRDGIIPTPCEINLQYCQLQGLTYSVVNFTIIQIFFF